MLGLHAISLPHIPWQWEYVSGIPFIPGLDPSGSRPGFPGIEKASAEEAFFILDI